MSSSLWKGRITSFGSGGNGGKARAGDSDDDDDDLDDLLDSGDENDTGLELEALVPSSPSRSRTGELSRHNSGNRLVRRYSPGALSPANLDSNSNARSGPCDSNTRKIARVGRIAARSVFRKNSRRISIWVLCVLAMILCSVFLDLFESSYITTLFGMVQDKESEFDKPPVDTSDGTTIQQQQHPDLPAAGAARVAPPTMAPITPRPILSVHEHMNNNNGTAPDPHNTFTTWLDFDDQDPPKRTKFPKPGDKDAFVAQWCDLTGTTWYPEPGSRREWQTRAPSFLLPGALYSGTVYLAAALHQHPHVIPTRTKELQFFHERPFRRYVSAQEKTLVRAARERMYARDYDTRALQSDDRFISFDASPGYLFYSSLIPRRILCVEPWVKLVLLLRNPVDRVLEHYAAAQKRGLKLSLEEWVEQDFALMAKVGLTNITADVETTAGSKLEDLAWYEYQTASVGGAIGRSLYVVQIRHWLQAIRAVGRQPATEILIVRTDHLAADPAREYQRVLRFLHLAEDGDVPQAVPPVTVTHQTRDVHPATRARLEDFFRPYNRRLKRLMRQHGISSTAEDDRFMAQ